MIVMVQLIVQIRAVMELQDHQPHVVTEYVRLQDS
jgi:hypothetical protein